MAYLLLDGTSGGYVSLPYRSEYNASNIVDLRGEIDFDAYSTAQTIIARYSGGSTTSPWEFYINGKSGIVRTRDTANTLETLVATAAFTLTPGTRSQLRATLDTTAGECKFYQRATGTALTDDSGWTQVGSTVAVTNNDIQEPTSQEISVGASQAGAARIVDGKVYRSVVKKDAATAGTLIVDVDFEDADNWALS